MEDNKTISDFIQHIIKSSEENDLLKGEFSYSLI